MQLKCVFFGAIGNTSLIQKKYLEIIERMKFSVKMIHGIFKFIRNHGHRNRRYEMSKQIFANRTTCIHSQFNINCNGQK